MTGLAIAETIDTDLDAVLAIHRRAFDGDAEAALVRDLIADPTALPRLSLLARDGDAPVGHVLFTAVRIEGSDLPVDAAILCPLAVVPEAQGRGGGGALVDAGLRRLADAGTALVFVLGDPAFYGRFGFIAAPPHGLAAPYDLPAAYAGAWQVCALHDDLPSFGGRIVCADALMQPHYWTA
jgi:putative acetyltransferase